jgi:hypothetical protein
MTASIHVSIRRWRDRINGNSYFSARCYADGKEIARLPFQYGYGSAPEWNAVAVLREAGILPDGREGLFSACDSAGIALTVDDYSALKRDVIAHGKKE